MLKLNLLPAAFKPKIILNADILLSIAGFVLGVSILTTLFIVIKDERKSKNAVASVDAKLRDQKQNIDKLRALEEKRDDNSAKDSTQALIANRRVWNPVLKELTYIMPNDVWMTKMVVTKSSAAVTMQLFGLAPSQSSVNKFFGRMERSTSYREAVLNSSQKRNDYIPSLYAFEMSVKDLFVDDPTRTIASKEGDEDGAKGKRGKKARTKK
jgi:Tfp pilus assembly protein PilN